MNNNQNAAQRKRLGEERRADFFEVLKENPVVSAAAGLSAVAGACVSLENALVLSATVLILLPCVCALAALEKGRINERLRPAAFFVFAALIVLLISLAADSIFSGSVTATGIFAPLLAAEALSMCSRTETRRSGSALAAAREGAATALSFVLIALPVGLIRGFFGRAELLGLFLGFTGCDAFTLPGTGFILCGVALAVYRALRGGKESPAEQRRAGEEL